MYGPRGSIVSNELPWVGQMPRLPENLTMDSGVKFTKPNTITISYSVAVLLGFCLVACCLGTGLLVYHLTTSSHEKHEENATAISFVQEDCGAVSTPSTTPSTTSARTIVSEKNVRLPKSVVPMDYRLKIVPYLYENFTFRGEVRISVDVLEETSNITLHITELKIEEESVRVARDNQSVQIARLEYEQDLQFFILHFPRDLSPGTHEIFIKFSGVLNNILQGFYRSSYPKNNETRWIAATQFQSTDARRAFPCFDEPALKATFEIIVGRPKSMSSISNMPKVKSEPMVGANYVWDYYEKSVPMSTYLVAFVVSDFESRSVGNFSVWARQDAINQTLYSLEVGPQLLKFYEEYFNISFPLAKIDLIALPDFSAGAMENWGLITFRESNLLYEENVSSRTNKQSIAIVIAHEIAHQWFGNLVTPSWWTDLWLNEGFASYLEYTGTDSVRSDWKVLDQFVVYELQLVFSLDALKSSHPISIEVNNPEEINDIFDRISYGKGATIIRMMEHFLTTEVFKKGLTNYLNDKMYSSAQQDDLWSALTQQARADGIFDDEMNVKQIMDTWTLQTGFPVVTVTRNYDGNGFTLKQEQFSLDGVKSRDLWWIPISYKSSKEATRNIWMRRETELSIQNNIEADDWLLVNINQTGYYRVNYDTRNWELIIKQLKKSDGHLVFDPKNRAQIVDDALNLASAGYLEYELAMNVTTYLIQEKDFVPWKAAFRGLDYIYEMFVRSGHFGKFKKYMLNTILPLYKEIGFKDYSKDPLLTIYVRGEILPRACRYGYKDCIRNAILFFNNWRVTPNPDVINPIPPNLKNLVYCNAIKFGGEEEWQFAWERYLNTNVGSERETILAALACTKETWLLNRYLTMAITEGSGIRKQDAPAVLAGVARNIVGQNLVYKFLTGNWDNIKTYMGSSFISLNGIIRSITLNFNTQQEVEDLKSFARKRKKDLSVSSRSITQAIEQAEANVKWMDRNFQNIVNWLDNVDESTRR